MRFSTYADVLTHDHPMSKAYARGQKKTPGALLADILRETDGRYEVTVELPVKFLDDVRRVAKLTGDDRLAAHAAQSRVTISLDHLREYDPSSTRIVYGCRLDRETGGGDLSGFDR